MFSRKAFLRGDPDSFSEVTTAVGTPLPSSPDNLLHPSSSSKRVERYKGPKRTYSLVRGNGSKDVLRLVDKAGGSQTEKPTAESEMNCLGDYHIDFIELGRFSVASTAANTPPLSPAGRRDEQDRNISINLAVASKNSQEEVNSTEVLTGSKDEWSILELDTKQFLSTVASQSPATTATKKATANPSLAKAIKASIKKTGRGLVIRLLQRLASGDEEFTDIYMLREAEANNRVTRWLRGSPLNIKAPKVITDEIPTSQGEDSPYLIAEVDGAQVHEMMDTSHPAEFPGTNFPFPNSERLNDSFTLSSSNTNTISVPSTDQDSSPYSIGESLKTSIAEITSPIHLCRGPFLKALESFDDDLVESSQMKLDRNSADRASAAESNTSPFIPLHIPQLARKFSFESTDTNDSPGAAPRHSTSQKGKEMLIEVENEARLEDSPSNTSSKANHVVQARVPGNMMSPFTRRPRFYESGTSKGNAKIESMFPDIDEKLASHALSGRPEDRSRLWLDAHKARSQPGSRDEEVFSNLQTVNTSESLGHDLDTISDNLRLANEDKIENRTFASEWRYILSTTRQDVSSTSSQSIHKIISYTTLVIQAFLQISLRGLESLIYNRDLFWTIPRDHIRIRWTCKCGMKLFDDFIEKRTGAARLLEQHLNRPKQRPSGSERGSSSSSVPSTPNQTSINNQSTTATSIGPPTTSREKSSTASKYTPKLNTGNSLSTIPTSPFLEQLWVLACAERQKFTTKLVHLDADSQKIRSDMELARLLKTNYSSLRSGWKQFLRLRGLITIQFVQFELHRSQVVDIRKCPDMPDRDDIGYLFFPSDLIPPVGERYLMHLFHHPEDYEDETITYKRIPKKRGAKLRVGERDDIEVGWGIHLVEGFLAYKVWSLFTSIFILVSITFGVTWAVKRGDVQGAFGVAAYVGSFATLFIGCFVAYLE